jgi:hydrogenase-4 component F
LVLVGLVAVALTVLEIVVAPNIPFAAGFVRIDSTSRLFLMVVNPIFLGVALYVRNRLAVAPALRSGMTRFVLLCVLFVVSANAVLVAYHLVVLWLALEITTLAAAPLIVRAAGHASRRASFHYLLFSSVGLGLVLLGIEVLAASMERGGASPRFFLDQLPLMAASVNDPLSQLGVSLVLLGIGTKLGLAPMYAWLPEAYTEAPPAVAALLSAVQFNCALVFLLRVLQVFRASHASLINNQLIAMGLASMVVASASIIATRDMRRLLAYASINHAGVIAIGLGIGKPAAYGTLLYVVSNAFIKVTLFLTAGKIEAHYRTKDTRRIAGLLRDLPYSGVFLMIGTLALLGFPPFGSFVGELLVLSALVSSGRLVVFAMFCLLVTISFVATGRTIFPMIWGRAPSHPASPRQTFLAASPKIVFLLALVALGLYVPQVIQTLMQAVAASLEVS